MQLSQLRLAAFKFLSVLLSNSTYTELLVTPKGQGDVSEGQRAQDIRSALKSAMKLMTQCAVLSHPIGKSTIYSSASCKRCIYETLLPVRAQILIVYLVRNIFFAVKENVMMLLYVLFQPLLC